VDVMWLVFMNAFVCVESICQLRCLSNIALGSVLWLEQVRACT